MQIRPTLVLGVIGLTAALLVHGSGAPDPRDGTAAAVAPAGTRPAEAARTHDHQGRDDVHGHALAGPVAAATLPSLGPVTWSPDQYDGLAPVTDQPDLTTLPTVHVVYLHASDQPSRFADLAPMIQAEDRMTSTRFASVMRRGVRWDERRGADGRRYHDMTVVRSAATFARLSSSEQWSLVHNDLSNHKLTNPNKKYLVWVDAGSAYCGQSQNLQDARRSAKNSNNSRTMSTVYAYYDRTNERGGFCTAQFHELSHAFGAVQRSAPHDSGGHCNDNGNDVMCSGSSTIPYDPASTVRYYDYNNDDYLDPHVDPGHNASSGTPRKLGWWTVNLSRFLCASSADPSGLAGCDKPNDVEY